MRPEFGLYRIRPYDSAQFCSRPLVEGQGRAVGIQGRILSGGGEKVSWFYTVFEFVSFGIDPFKRARPIESDFAVTAFVIFDAFMVEILD